LADEVPAILQRGETRAAARNPDDFRAEPRTLQSISIRLTSMAFAAPKATILADIARAVRKGQKHL
jgi:hypothetical protein